METRTEFESGSMAEFFGAVHDAGRLAGEMSQETATRVTTHEISGRTYIKEGPNPMREVRPPRTILRLPPFGSIADFAEGVRKHAKSPAVVMVNASGVICYLRPECREDEKDVMTFAPFLAALPTEDKLTYVGFLELLDKYTGLVRDEKDIRTALAVLKAVKTSAVKFEDKGAYTHITMEAGANVQAGAMDIPKALQFTVAYGDPSYTMPLFYRLHITVEGDGLAFRLVGMPNVDKRDEVFVTQALVDLREALKGTEHEVYRAA